jgi:hypothetical protein
MVKNEEEKRCQMKKLAIQSYTVQRLHVSRRQGREAVSGIYRAPVCVRCPGVRSCPIDPYLVFAAAALLLAALLAALLVDILNAGRHQVTL